MKQIEKLKTLAKLTLTVKDYKLILGFIEAHDFDNFLDIIKSELVREYAKCKPEEMTERYCQLQDIFYLLQKYDISDTYIDKCINYEEE